MYSSGFQDISGVVIPCLTLVVPEEGVLLLLQQGPEGGQLCSGVTFVSVFQFLSPKFGQRAVTSSSSSSSFLVLVLLSQPQRVSYLRSEGNESAL